MEALLVAVVLVLNTGLGGAQEDNGTMDDVTTALTRFEAAIASEDTTALDALLDHGFVLEYAAEEDEGVPVPIERAPYVDGWAALFKTDAKLRASFNRDFAWSLLEDGLIRVDGLRFTFEDGAGHTAVGESTVYFRTGGDAPLPLTFARWVIHLKP